MNNYNNYKDNLKIYHRRVKYLRVEVGLNQLKFILPRDREIDFEKILKRFQKWIRTKEGKLDKIKELAKNLETIENEKYKELIENYIDEISGLLKVYPAKIKYRIMKKRFGSCNYSNKVITFSKFLKFLPNDLIKYIVIHEMCHLIIPNHKKEFRLLVKKLCPDYKEKENLLAAYKIKLGLF